MSRSFCLSGRTGPVCPATACLSLQHGLEGRGGGIFKTPPFCSFSDSRGEISTFLVTASCCCFLPSRLDLGYKVLGVFVEKAPLCPTWCWVGLSQVHCLPLWSFRALRPRLEGNNRDGFCKFPEIRDPFPDNSRGDNFLRNHPWCELSQTGRAQDNWAGSWRKCCPWGVSRNKWREEKRGFLFLFFFLRGNTFLLGLSWVGFLRQGSAKCCFL